MTLPLACPPPTSCSSSTTNPPTVPPRKRRRRAPASGASDDCFACVKRNTKCDRRRPYCSQCLEIGKECSGYKTQLTWGVGVASRGKLRGLSLPVARSAPAPKSPPRTRPRTVSAIARAPGVAMEDVKVKVEVHTLGPVPVNPFTTYDFINMAPNGSMSPSTPTSEWGLGIENEYPLPEYHHEAMHHQRRLPQLHRLHTLSIGGGDGLGLSSSIDSMSAYADSDYASPMSQSFQFDDIPFPHSPLPMYNSFSSRNSTADQSPIIGSMMGDSRGPTSCPEQFYAHSEMSSSLSSHQNLYDIHEGQQHQPASPAHHDAFYDDDFLGGPQVNDMEAYATSTRSSHFGWNAINDDEIASQSASEPEISHRSHDSMSSTYSETSPRVSFFLDYYERIICPSVVVIDSPSNPYREHILSLAAGSQSLQHAICALSACNLRMKRKQSLGQDHWRQSAETETLDRVHSSSIRPIPTRRTSYNPLSPEAQPQDSALQEEYQHRSLAVSLLNQQLSDPSKARNDAVLATLFILCHYRMCESGIAQFRTQFAGVKKILGMRDSGASNWGWMESLFTYFDGVAASINDRESQLHGGFLDMLANPANSNHALENLAGCDSVLFQTIGKLGRLNLLSQHRPVQDNTNPQPDSSSYSTSPPLIRRPVPALPSPRPKLAGQALVDFYNLHSHNFDGNGFASTLDEDISFPPHTSSLSHEELRNSFWNEWKSTRLSLQEWEFDAARLVSALPSPPSSTQLRDFGYISEAFRYAALLYTERLAWPNVTSSHLAIQNLVSQVLFYVTSLEPGSGAEKFLLWPLFICGSECVNELQQSIVRQKCREIMRRSGYLNNLAGLEVLESVWAEKNELGGAGHSMDGRRPDWAFGRPPFRWSRYMEGVEGEWIMF